MRILFADPFGEPQLSQLTAAGHQCVVQPSTATELPSRVAGFDVLVVRSTKVTAETVQAADRLGLIVRAGAGTDNVDHGAASSAGIYLCNVPGRNAIAVAELTIGLLLAIDRHIADSVADLRNGQWDKHRYSVADGVHGKRLAIIGVGDIGLAVAERARALGLTIAALRKDSRPPSVQNRIRSIGIRLFDTLDELLAQADIVSLHVPQSDETIGLVDAGFLAKLPDRAIVLNTSRGEVIDERALLHALDTRSMRAGIDVYRGEPTEGTCSWRSELASHPAVVGTHHIGASTAQAQQSVAEGVVEVIASFEAGEPINCVNVAKRRTDTATLIVRHLDRVGALAKVLAVLREHELNIQQMQNQIFDGGCAAVASMQVVGAVDERVLAALRGLDDVIAAASGK